MGLPLRESRAARELAEILYDFLPGSGSAGWKGHISFKSVAQNVGVGDFWQSGSKQPMIAQLFERTLEHRRGRFEQLVVEVVRAGLTYRHKNGKAVTAAEIEKINGLLLEIGFKFPDLSDPDFLASLRSDSTTRAADHLEKARVAESLREAKRSKRSLELEDLRGQFLALHAQTDRQAAGLSLEPMLNRLFELHSLAPREPFRVVGEQIDGSFELDNEVYLLEAKWHKEPRPVADLYVFREKIEGKSKFTRGVFVSINGVSKEATAAITQGKQPNFFIVDGYDLLMCLQDSTDLAVFLRRRQRLLAEQGRVTVPFQDCGL
jgi:hypothetical protein